MPVCYSDLDCGANRFVYDKYCGTGSNVYWDYRVFTCRNPGTLQSYCAIQDTSTMVQQCSYGCYDAECLSEPLSYAEQLLTVRVDFLDSEVVQPGDTVFLGVTANSEVEGDLKELRITAAIQELGIRDTKGPFTLHSGETMSKTLVLDIPYSTPPGEYWVRFTVSNDDVERIIYRVITVR